VTELAVVRELLDELFAALDRGTDDELAVVLGALDQWRTHDRELVEVA
jgi:hypothetical protein